MRKFGLTALMLMLAGPALAQAGADKNAKSPAQIEADKAAERAYQRSLGLIPDKGPVDPWGVARSSDAPPPTNKTTAQKPAKPKTKTGSAGN